jgi:hypothetical protein
LPPARFRASWSQPRMTDDRQGLSRWLRSSMPMRPAASTDLPQARADHSMSPCDSRSIPTPRVKKREPKRRRAGAWDTSTFRSARGHSAAKRHPWQGAPRTGLPVFWRCQIAIGNCRCFGQITNRRGRRPHLTHGRDARLFASPLSQAKLRLSG